MPLTMLGKRAPDDIVYTRGRQVGAKEKLDRRPQKNENSRVKHERQFGTKKGLRLRKSYKEKKVQPLLFLGLDKNPDNNDAKTRYRTFV